MAKPLLKWPGGKRWLAPKIAPYFKESFTRYIEPFLGGGALLFALEPHAGIVSDINPELIACYQAIRKDAHHVLLEFNKLQNSESEYYRIRDQWNPHCEFKRAARLIYLLRHSWNGLYRVNRNGHFNVPYCPRRRKNTLLRETLKNIQSILRRVNIRCEDFEKVISKTGAGDLIFADPPYFGNDQDKFGRYNSVSFSDADQQRLAKALAIAEHNGAAWVLTNGSLEKVKRPFQKYDIFVVPRFLSIAAAPRFRGTISEYIVLSKSKSLDGTRRFLENNYERLID